MKSAGKRLRKCVVCQGRLPAGSRVDRQYCRQACITRAYYGRHPDKKRVLSSRTPKQAEAEGCTLRQADEATNKLARLETENATLRQRIGRTSSAALDPTSASPKETARGVLELEAHLEAALRRAESAEQQLSNAYEQIAELQRQRTAEPMQVNHAEPASQRAVAPKRHTTQKQTHTAELGAPQPWEWSPQLGQPPIAKWRGLPAASFDRLREFSQQVMASVPTEMYKQGDRRSSKLMREWLAMPANAEPLSELCFRIVLLTVSTDREQRRKSSQREQLAVLALDGALETMTIDAREHEQEIRQVLDRDRTAFERLASELVSACQGKALKFSARKGRWYLPKNG